ncbi:MAG TPA: DUF5709 domain-containing protein [Micromonosporaceae bacterium]|nr:DUF5709 domain-containing protein [Micromonosporaceae bacterium]
MDPDDEFEGRDEWDDVEDDGVLDASDTLDDDAVGDPLDVGIAASDRWSGANRYGTTMGEQQTGESLDARLAEEEPDVTYDYGDMDEDELTRRGYETEPRAGRLVSEDEGLGPDLETDAVAFDVGIDAGAATAEEAAVHLVDDPNGEGDGPLS